MDSFPVQPAESTPIQQVPVQPAETFVQSPIQTPPQQKRDLRKFFNLSSWIFLFTFLPITILIFLSQDSLPGDNFYPIKRGLENVILAVASVNPATRAAFRTDLTETRFKEAQSLIIAKANAGGLASFTQDVQAVQLEVTSLTNSAERAKAEEKLLVKIDQYQNSLSNLQAKTEQNLIVYSVQETPTLASPPSGEPINTAPNQNQASSVLPLPTPTSLPAGASAKDGVLPTILPSQNQTTPNPISPTSIPMSSPISSKALSIAPTSVPTIVSTLIPTSTAAPDIPIQQENIQVARQEEIAQTLKETKEKLDKIKKDLEEKRRENRGENTQRSVGNNNEGETQSQRKNDSNKETEIPSRQK